MKKHIVNIAMFMTVVNATAQSTASSIDTTSIAKQRKNEIGINTTPLLSPLLFGNIQDVSRFSVSYKRILNEKYALRFAIEFDYSAATNIPCNNQFIIFQAADNSIVMQMENYPDYFRPHINLGLEKYFGKGKLKCFYGADLVVGYYKETYSKRNIYLFQDSTSYYVNWTDYGQSTETILTRTSTALSFGISPFIGVKYAISKRFSVSVQSGSDFSYQIVNETASDKNNNIKKTNFSTFDFASAGFINNISIIYKF